MAGDLEAGDRILALDGSYGTVEALEVVEQTQTMYDLTVAEVHNELRLLSNRRSAIWKLRDTSDD